MPAYKWVAHLKTKAQQEEFAVRVVNSKEVLDVLKNILETEVKGLDKAMLDRSHYGLSSWEYFQADQLGSKRALLKVLSLLQD